jgi:hypothetical protein
LSHHSQKLIYKTDALAFENFQKWAFLTKNLQMLYVSFYLSVTLEY